MNRNPSNSRIRPALVALTGFMGSGKSSVGRALASLAGWNFVDLDVEIETSQGQQIRDIFRLEGEEGFRALESAALGRVLTDAQRPMVLSLGGGTFVQRVNVNLLQANGAIVVFLEASPEILLRRCFPESDEGEELRPLAADKEGFLRLYERRISHYRTADLKVDSNGRSPEAVARDIANRLRLISGSKLIADS